MRIKLILLLLFCVLTLAAVDVNQAPVPTISVSLTGFVQTPGVYQVLPVSKLSDLISRGTWKAALPTEVPVPAEPGKSAIELPSVGLEFEEDVTPTDYIKQIAYRTVKLTRNGQSKTYDLLRFYRLGDDSQNPFLKDGDIVWVGAVQDFVNISGSVFQAGDVQFVEGDKLKDILGFASGTPYSADLSAVKIYRYAADRVSFEVLSLDLLGNPSLYNHAMQAGDRIVIPTIQQQQNPRKVNVIGQVRNPGEYLIKDNSSLAEILRQAGWVTNKGDLEKIVCFNSNLHEKPSPYLNQLMTRSMSDMTPLEYSYLRTNLQQLKGKYSIDTAKFAASEGKEADLILHDGDTIYVPELIHMVWVSGQVRNPGLIPWVEGKDWDYYIAQAGGYNNNRKHGKGRIIRGESGNWVKPGKDVQIWAGDTVFIPNQTDRALWTDIKEGITLVSSLVTIIVGLRALSTN